MIKYQEDHNKLREDQVVFSGLGKRREGMNKPLLLFISFSILLLIAVLTYSKYCESKPNGCKQEKYDEDNLGPKEGIDW